MATIGINIVDTADMHRCQKQADREKAKTAAVTTIRITIYFINASGKLKLSFDQTTKNISQ